jgi:translation elongation factor EF-Ts
MGAAEDIKTLRERMGADPDCKKALAESNGDSRRLSTGWGEGIANAAKKVGRAATEGLVAYIHAGARSACCSR